MLKYIIKDSNGIFVYKIMRILNKNTHCGKYWNTKSRFNIFKMRISQIMCSNEGYFYDLKTSIGHRENYDGAHNVRKFKINKGKIKWIKNK